MIAGFGSSHIDILATVTGDPDTKDRIGDVRMDIGGTGGNIAVNCAALGAPVKFSTALNGSAHSRIIIEHLERSKVDVNIWEDRSLPMAAFVAQINKKGEMDSAISCMPVERVVFSNEWFVKGMEDAEIVFCDCNFSVSSIVMLSQQCVQRLLPFFIAAVSEEKSLRAVQAIKMGATCDGLFINRSEIEYIKRHYLESNIDVRSKVIADMRLSETIGCPLIITEGEDGALLVDGNQVSRIRASQIVEIKSFLGAGDAFMAATLTSMWRTQKPLLQALDQAAEIASVVVSRENCNLAEAKAIDRAIDFFHDEARKDGLTQIYNRTSTLAFGNKLLSKMLKQGKPFGVIILDIDHFKNINDTWGHSTGDVVIQKVANVVSFAMRDYDICGRWGGEEFVCLLPGASVEITIRVAERIRETIESTLLEPRNITVSLGVAMVESGWDLNKAIERADEALYISKRSGRNMTTMI